MVGGALDLLAARDRGYFLMVEGGRIDHAHHYGNAHRALVEGQEFSRAVQVALDRVDLRETLVIVTADHSHVFTMAGYPTRGNAILGKVVGNDEHGEPRRQPTLADDGLPFTTLGYANGYGFGHGDDIHQRLRRGGSTGRRDLSGIDVTDKNFYQEALVPLRRGERAETHGGEDVAVYAAGPWAHLVHGVREQNYLYYVIRHALDPAP
jgi:alkaline phosphatase